MGNSLDKLKKQTKSSPTLRLLKQRLGGGGAHGKPVDGGANTSSPQTVGNGKPPQAAETPKAMKQEILGPDPLHDAAHVIENLPDEATAMAKIHQLIDEQGLNYFELGGTLQVMHEKKWYAGRQTFGELCEEEFGFSRRKAEYLIRIYNFLGAADMTWEQVKAVGWTMMRVLPGKVDPKAAQEWVEKAASMSVQQLREEVKVAKVGQETGQKQVASSVLTKTFKLHADQKESLETALDKAKKEVSTEADAVALEHVCMTFLSPGASVPKEKPEATVKAVATSPGDPGYVWPSVKAMCQHVLAEHDGDVDQTMKSLFDPFEEVFPSVAVTVKII